MTELSGSEIADLRDEYLELKERIGATEGAGRSSEALRQRLAVLEGIAQKHGVELIPPRRFGRRA